MGEGSIEGIAADYEIGGTDPFATTFKYSRYSATYALPRNASALTGMHRHVPRTKMPRAAVLENDVEDEREPPIETA